MDANLIIRHAALDLELVDSKEVVKVAGILGRIKNYFADWSNPNAAALRARIGDEGQRINDTMIAASLAVKRLLKAIDNVDTRDYEAALEAVRQIIPKLSKELADTQNTADKINETASEGVVLSDGTPISTDELEKARAGIGNPKVVSQVQEDFPPDNDVPYGKNLYKDKDTKERYWLQDFKWFKDVKPNHIGISDLTYRVLTRGFIEGVKPVSIEAPVMEAFMAKNKSQIENAFRLAILNSKLIKYQIIGEAKKGISSNKNRGDTAIVVYVKDFYLPNSKEVLGNTLYFSFGLVLHDQKAAGRIDHVLSVASYAAYNGPKISGGGEIPSDKSAQAYGPFTDKEKFPETASSPEKVPAAAVPKSRSTVLPSVKPVFGSPASEWLEFFEVAPQQERANAHKLAVNSLNKSKDIISKLPDDSINLDAVMAELDAAGNIFSALKDDKGLFEIFEAKEKVKKYFPSSSIPQPPKEPISEASSGPIEKMVRTAMERSHLPSTRALIKLDGDELSFNVRYAHILSSALREEIGADTSVHYGNGDVQIECDVVGSEKPVEMALHGLCLGVSDAFEMATGRRIGALVKVGISSPFDILEADLSEECFRKFSIAMLEAKND